MEEHNPLLLNQLTTLKQLLSQTKCIICKELLTIAIRVKNNVPEQVVNTALEVVIEVVHFSTLPKKLTNQSKIKFRVIIQLLRKLLLSYILAKTNTEAVTGQRY